jgi:hypothetical protein
MNTKENLAHLIYPFVFIDLFIKKNHGCTSLSNTSYVSNSSSYTCIDCTYSNYSNYTNRRKSMSLIIIVISFQLVVFRVFQRQVISTLLFLLLRVAIQLVTELLHHLGILSVHQLAKMILSLK